jgi:hypothetical protein
MLISYNSFPSFNLTNFSDWCLSARGISLPLDEDCFPLDVDLDQSYTTSKPFPFSDPLHPVSDRRSNHLGWISKRLLMVCMDSDEDKKELLVRIL